MEATWPTFNDVFLTSIRWSVGLCGAAVGGLALALGEALIASRASYQANILARAIGGTMNFLRALPVIALVPLVQMFGVDEWWKISLIAWAATFPIWLSIRQALNHPMIDTELVLFGSGVSSSQIFWSYRFPRTLGGLINGLEISIGVAWISVVAAEWVGTFTTGFWAGGLGYKVLKAHDANNIVGMLSCLGLFGVLGTLTAQIWSKIPFLIAFIHPGFDPTISNADISRLKYRLGNHPRTESSYRH